MSDVLAGLAEEMGALAARHSKRRRWTAGEDDLVRDFYPDVPTDLIAIALRRTTRAVYTRAKQLGLSKSEWFKKTPLSGCAGWDERGAESRFPRGHRPWNKGAAYQPGGRSAETRFKPGHRPRNWKPIGHERVCSDGYRWRKVRDGQKPTVKNYEPVHILVWEENCGPVPDGQAVVFRNGDKADIRIENLELVSRAELMRRNTRHRYPEHINRAIAAKAALTRRINKLEKRA